VFLVSVEASILAEGAVVFFEFPRTFGEAEFLADEEFEGAIGRFVGVAELFTLFDGGEDVFGFGASFLEREAEFFGGDEDVGLARELGDENVLGVADELWLDVLVAVSNFLDGVDMHAAFVGEGGLADKGSANEVRIVGDVVDKEGEVLEVLEVGDDLVAELELKDGDDGGEIAVSGAFSVAINGALDLGGSSAAGFDGVSDSELAIVVGVNTDFNLGEDLANELCDLSDFVGKGAAVGVAENDIVCATIYCC